METNKAKAFRGREMAKRSMEIKDFVGAQKIALRAQTLYPEIEKIPHIVTICKVHISAKNETLGEEKDWHKILDVEKTADKATIESQYKKLALLLHPDKNQFAGAYEAFILICEARRVLLDIEKRKSHDLNRDKASIVDVSAGENKETIWTICTNCFVRFQFYKKFLNKKMRCQCCKETFFAREISERRHPTHLWENNAQPRENSVKEGLKVAGKSKAESVDAQNVEVEDDASSRRRSARSKRKVSYKDMANGDYQFEE